MLGLAVAITPRLTVHPIEFARVIAVADEEQDKHKDAGHEDEVNPHQHASPTMAWTNHTPAASPDFPVLGVDARDHTYSRILSFPYSRLLIDGENITNGTELGKTESEIQKKTKKKVCDLLHGQLRYACPYPILEVQSQPKGSSDVHFTDAVKQNLKMLQKFWQRYNCHEVS